MTQSIHLTNLSVATMSDDSIGYGLIEDAGLVIEDDKIAWVGPMSDLPPQYSSLEIRSFDGRLVTPALIDWVI